MIAGVFAANVAGRMRMILTASPGPGIPDRAANRRA
jgi:hypothetical protein